MCKKFIENLFLKYLILLIQYKWMIDLKISKSKIFSQDTNLYTNAKKKKKNQIQESSEKLLCNNHFLIHIFLLLIWDVYIMFQYNRRSLT